MAKRTIAPETEKKAKKKGTPPAELQLTDGERGSLLYLDARIKNAELARRLKEKEFNENLRNLKMSYAADVGALETEKRVAKEQLEALKVVVEEKYGIKLSDYTFHEETGKLILPPKNE